MKASTRQQHLLIDLQNLDTELLRLERRLKQLPEREELLKLESLLKDARAEFFEKQKLLEDLQFEIARVESDIKLVRDREAATTTRLNSSSAAKEANALQNELETLKKRAGILEDKALELMEQSEEAEAVKDAAQNSLSKLEDQRSQLTDSLASAQQEIAVTEAGIKTERAGLAAEIQGDLRELYEKTRERYGMGAAKLMGRVSGGSNMELDAADFAHVSSLAEDEIYFCPVSGVILVRDIAE